MDSGSLNAPIQRLLVFEAPGGLGGRAQDLHPPATMMIKTKIRMTSMRPVEGELALSAEEVDVVLELELEDVVLVDLVRGARGVHAVAKEGQARQGEVIWREGWSFVEIIVIVVIIVVVIIVIIIVVIIIVIVIVVIIVGMACCYWQ